MKNENEKIEEINDESVKDEEDIEELIQELSIEERRKRKCFDEG